MSQYWTIYEEELGHIGYGLPVWNAEPNPPALEIQVGDVGYMREGVFHRVFNIVAELGTLNTRGVPFVHLPLPRAAFDVRDWQHPAPIDNAVLKSKTASVLKHSVNAGVDFQLPVGLSAGYSLASSRDHLAALFLHEPAKREQYSESVFRAYADPLWPYWEYFAASLPLHADFCQDLALVYGTAKTTRWAALVAERTTASREFAFDVHVSTVAGVGLARTRELQEDVSPIQNHGPRRLLGGSSGGGGGNGSSESSLPRNQTVFIRRLKSTDRSLLRRMRRLCTLVSSRCTSSKSAIRHSARIAGMGSPDQSPDDSCYARSSSSEYERSIEELDILLMYLLVKSPQAGRATASDDDLDALMTTYRAVHGTDADCALTALTALQPPTQVRTETLIARLDMARLSPPRAPALSWAAVAGTIARPRAAVHRRREPVFENGLSIAVCSVAAMLSGMTSVPLLRAATFYIAITGVVCALFALLLAHSQDEDAIRKSGVNSTAAHMQKAGFLCAAGGVACGTVGLAL